MWHRFLLGLSSLWPRLWPLLLASGIASSLTAAFLYLFKRRDEGRESRKKLTAELYLPARRQLAEALQAINEQRRALALNIEMWKAACSAGVTRRLKPSLRLQLESLYERTLPDYDRAWQALNEEIDRMRAGWDKQFADLRDYATASKEHNIVEINWWNFLTGDGPVTPIDGLRDRDVLRLWNAFMTPARFKLLNRSPEQILNDCWHEAARNEALRHFRELRGRALQDIPKAVAALDENALY